MAHKVYIRHSGEVVSSHPLARQGFAQTLSRISDRDYPRKGYFADTDIPAIDIDTYETSRPGSNSRTADAAIGICDESGGRRTRHRLLLVELRMDYSTVTNLHVGEMTEKLPDAVQPALPARRKPMAVGRNHQKSRRDDIQTRHPGGSRNPVGNPQRRDRPIRQESQRRLTDKVTIDI